MNCYYSVSVVVVIDTEFAVVHIVAVVIEVWTMDACW